MASYSATIADGVTANVATDSGFELGSPMPTNQNSTTVTRVAGSVQGAGQWMIAVRVNAGTGTAAGLQGAGVNNSVSGVAGDQWTPSAWVIIPSGVGMQILMRFNNTDGTSTIVASSTQYGTGVAQRIKGNGLAATKAYNGVSVKIYTTATATSTFTFYVDDVQIEQGANMSPYVPSYGTFDTANRTASAQTSPIAESTGISDSDTRIFRAVRGFADASIASDALTRQSNRPRGTADTTTVADAINHAGTIARTQSETTNLSDAWLHNGAYNRTASEITALGDVAARFVIALRLPSESTSLTDVASRASRAIRSVLDSVTGLADNAAVTRFYVRSVAESWPLGDTIAIFRLSMRSLSDTNTISDVVARTQRFAKNAADNVLASDVAAAMFWRIRLVFDSIAGLLEIATAQEPRDVTLAFVQNVRNIIGVIIGRQITGLTTSRHIITTATINGAAGMTIPASQGDTEFLTVTVEETTGLNLATSTFFLSLGSATAPGAWLGPDSTSVTNNVATLQLLLPPASMQPIGIAAFYLWVKVVDSPETIIRRVGAVQFS